MNNPTTAPMQKQYNQALMRKSLLAAGLGQALEWFDWLIFALLSAVISKQFFPPDDPAAALLSTLAVFGVGFFFRPLGGILLARFTDKKGRKAGMILTILMMSGGALIIGIAPGYAQIGIFAPILLVLARILQGLSAGGEFAAVAAYMAEHSPPGKRGQYGSVFYVTSNTGALLATLLVPFLNAALGQDVVASWGWRIPFVFAALLGLLTLLMRRGASETEAFLDQLQQEKVSQGSLGDLFANHFPDVVRIFFISGLVGVWYYVFASYLPAFLSSKGMDPQSSFTASTIAIAVCTVMLPFLGRWSDLFGRRKMIIGFTALCTLGAVPLFSMLQPNFWSQLAVQLVALFIFSLYGAVGPIMAAEQFPTRVRAMGIGVPYGVGVAIFGGSAPYLMQKLSASGMSSVFNWYLVAMGFLAFLASLSIKERRHGDLSDTERKPT
jgi:MHS family alpha-ketoglutarate permease-like MFS transporter